MKLYLLLIACTCLFSCQQKEKISTSKMDINTLEKDIQVLSSDSMEGRAPCSIGETRTLAYLEKRMQEIGLQPAFNESYFQEVPLVKVFSKVENTISLSNKGKNTEMENGTDISIWSPLLDPEISLQKNELIFVGFGIDAPENQWNDFDETDVTGKTIVVLVNDPGFYTQDSTFFKGNTMTYYGRWRYKFEEAERKGAAGCIIVHEEAAAGYPWAVASRRSAEPEYYLKSQISQPHHCKIQGWMSRETAEKLFALSGLNYDLLKQEALKKTFKAVPLHTSLSVTLKNTWEECASHNVGGYIKGSARSDESIIYVGHWDHLGIGKTVEGDSIYNGASDNAAAMAWVLSIAEEFAAQKKKPERSVLFFIPTAEEPGLFGSEYYVNHPVFPIEKTVACINSDVILFLGKFKDVTITGMGHSELDEYVRLEALKQNRYIANDPNPENGMFFRSDQLPFLKAGVPCIFAKGYSEQRELGKEKTHEKINEYWKTIYHKPQDEYVPERDNLEGLFEDAQLFYSIGNRLANEKTFPKWNKSSEFYKERL